MYERILVPLDGSDTAQRGLREAIALASQLKSSLLLLYVIDDFPMLVEVASVENYREMMTRLRKAGESTLSRASTLAENARVQADTRLCESTPKPIAERIVESAIDGRCQLIVMGTHGRRGLHRMAMGSDAEMVLRTSPVPVLLVRHPEAPGA